MRIAVAREADAAEDRVAATPETVKKMKALGADVAVEPGAGVQAGIPDADAVLERLAGRGITRLMVETGPILAAAFLRADLLDEAVVFRASKVIGPDGIDALDGLPLSALTQGPRLKSLGRAVIGADTVERFERT